MDRLFDRLALWSLDKAFPNGQRTAVITALPVPFTFEFRKSSFFLEKPLEACVRVPNCFLQAYGVVLRDAFLSIEVPLKSNSLVVAKPHRSELSI